MLPLIGGLGGVAWGLWLAKKRGGNRMDLAQYAAGYGILWAILGLIASIILVSLG